MCSASGESQEQSENVSNQGDCVLWGEPSPPKYSVPLVGMSATIFYQHHQVPFDILKTRQELGSRGIHWSDFCGCPYPGSMWSRMIHSASHCLGLCVTSHCRARGLVCCRGLAGANFGIDLAWKKIAYAARQQLIKPLPLWMLVFRYSQAVRVIQRHQADVPRRVPAAPSSDPLHQTLVKRDMGVGSARAQDSCLVWDG